MLNTIDLKSIIEHGRKDKAKEIIMEIAKRHEGTKKNIFTFTLCEKGFEVSKNGVFQEFIDYNHNLYSVRKLSKYFHETYDLFSELKVKVILIQKTCIGEYNFEVKTSRILFV